MKRAKTMRAENRRILKKIYAALPSMVARAFKECIDKAICDAMRKSSYAYLMSEPPLSDFLAGLRNRAVKEP